MENGAKAGGGVENVSVFHYLWGQGEKSLRELEKKEGGITIEKELLCVLLLPSQPFQVRCLEQKENQGRLCSHRPRTASEARLVTLPSVLTEQVGKG